MATADPRVAGESAHLVFSVLSTLRTRPAKHGMMHVRFGYKIDSPEGRAFTGALSRILGRLTAQDFLTEVTAGAPPRTEEQRRADALTQLAAEATAALSQGSDVKPPAAFGGAVS